MVPSHLPPFRNNYVHLTLPASFGRDNITGGPFCLVSMPGEVIDATQGTGK